MVFFGWWGRREKSNFDRRSVSSMTLHFSAATPKPVLIAFQAAEEEQAVLYQFVANAFGNLSQRPP